MPHTVIASLEQVTVGWLTAVLSNSGALTQGAVSDFDLVADQNLKCIRYS